MSNRMDEVMQMSGGPRYGEQVPLEKVSREHNPLFVALSILFLVASGILLFCAPAIILAVWRGLL